MKKILIFYIFIFVLYPLHAQQQAKHNLYHFNRNFINPAATGNTSCQVFSLTDKHQWSGIKNAPSIQTASAQFAKQINKYKKNGYGVNIVRDLNGATQNLGMELIYSFHFTVGRAEKTHLGLGLSGKFGQYSFDERDFTEDLYDPIVTRNINLEIYYNAASGIYLYNDKYFMGVALYNLLPFSTRYYREYGSESFFFTFHSGYHFLLPSKSLLKSSVYACKALNNYQIDINNHIYFNNKFRTGLTLRKYFSEYMNSGQNILIFIGYEINRWDLGYSYDLGINKLQLNHFGSHQISIGYKICRDKYACPTYKNIR